ncbi:P-loop containing nucleoside triphosphate hydrolase protein [Pisolithus thermaeus]|nr:P-loop containing nucleoside triphosphate hydrolase protein [Pisolithus thermaeus]
MSRVGLVTIIRKTRFSYLSGILSRFAWDTSIPSTIKLLAQHAKSTLSAPPELRFDEVLTGSKNKPVYNAVARSHVCAAMEGYNAVIFAYGQTEDLYSWHIVSALREEVVTSLTGAQELMERGERHRRTTSMDWNERSSRSQSVFRLVIESRERCEGKPEASGRQTPGLRPATLAERGCKQSVAESLIDLAGSEKATSDKERTREGEYINTSLLTLGSVISTLAENAAKNKNDHVPYRNSKLTCLLQPSLSGDARINVVCTVNPDVNAVTETTSTLGFASRIKRVRLHAKKKEVVDTEALIERYRKEIEELKRKLTEREAEAPARSRGLSAGELQQELLAAHRQIESQSNQILSLEASLPAHPENSPDAPESEKDKLIAEQQKTIRELEIVVRGYEDSPSDQSTKMLSGSGERLQAEARKREEKEAWATELVRQLEKEKRVHPKLEEERRALVAFVSQFDSLGLGAGSNLASKVKPAKYTPGGTMQALAERQQNRHTNLSITTIIEEQQMRMGVRNEPRLLDQTPEEDWSIVEDASFEAKARKQKGGGKRTESPLKEAFGRKKQNIPL